MSQTIHGIILAGALSLRMRRCSQEELLTTLLLLALSRPIDHIKGCPSLTLSCIRRLLTTNLVDGATSSAGYSTNDDNQSVMNMGSKKPVNRFEATEARIPAPLLPRPQLAEFVQQHFRQLLRQPILGVDEYRSIY